MPTQRKRHMITESDRITQALDAVAARWPELANDPGQQLRRVLEIGIEQLLAETAAIRAERAAALGKVAGSMPEVWPSSWREELRDEWPA